MGGLGPFVLIFVAGIVASFLASSITESLVGREHAQLDLDTRERVFQRLARLDMIWRLLSGLSYALIAIGFLRILGIIKGSSSKPWGIYCIVAGFGCICLDRILRNWARSWAYQAEAPGSRIISKSATAAALVTLIEGGLAIGIGYYILQRAVARTPSTAKTQNSNKKKGSLKKKPTPSQPNDVEAGKFEVMTESQVLKLLGKDKTYLDLLVRWGGIRTGIHEGKTIYRKDDIKSIAISSDLPSLERMRKELKEREAPQPPPRNLNTRPTLRTNKGDVLEE